VGGAGNRTYVLVILTLVYVVNYLDRQILGILLPYIQKEFALTDFQGGLLSGTVFAVI
jgi:sugar phosphate permease